MNNRLNEITIDTFREKIYQAFTGDITSIAPMGMSGETIVLSGVDGTCRISLVSLRKHWNDVQLLITNKEGSFLFCGVYDIRLGIEVVAQKYFDIFNTVKPYILEEFGEFELPKISDNVTYSEGFYILNSVLK